jgi:hypothetical protein
MEWVLCSAWCAAHGGHLLCHSCTQPDFTTLCRQCNVAVQALYQHNSVHFAGWLSTAATHARVMCGKTTTHMQFRHIILQPYQNCEVAIAVKKDCTVQCPLHANSMPTYVTDLTAVRCLSPASAARLPCCVAASAGCIATLAMVG